jgi:DNA primase
MASEEQIREIKRRADLGAVIGRYVQLKKSGRSLIGRCPFHQEKTPSFNVHPDEGFFKCFGCDAKGDVFSFLTRQTGQAFGDVLKQLAEETGVELDDRPETPEQAERRRVRKRCLQVLSLAQTYFRNQLRADEGKPARAYLREARGLDEEAVDRFGLGFGGMPDDGLIRHLKGEGVEVEEMLKAGVVADGRRGPYDFFRRRVTFPIRGTRGDALSFAGRAFGELLGPRAPKYVNGPASPVYDKSRVLYGLHESLPALKRKRPGVLVEGQLDVVAVHRADMPTAFAPCGTSLTERHVEEIKRYTDRVVLCLDADAAGQKATQKATLLFLQGGLDVSVAKLIDGDPDEMLKAGRGDDLRALLEGAPDAVDALIEDAKQKAIGSSRDRVRAIDELLPFLAAPPRDLTKRTYIRAAAEALGEDERVLMDEVERKGRAAMSRARHESSRNARPQSSQSSSQSSSQAGYDGPPAAPFPGDDPGGPPTGPAPTGPRSPARTGVKWSSAEKLLAKALLTHPLLVPRAGVLTDGLRNPELRIVIRELSDAVVRHHDQPPLEVLKRTRLPGGEVMHIVETIHRAGGFTDPERVLNEHEAAAAIDDFLRRSDQRPVHERVRELQRAMAAAQEADDHSEWRRLEALHREMLELLRKKEGDVSLPPPPLPSGFRELPERAPPTPSSLEGPPVPDVPEDTGVGRVEGDPGFDPEAEWGAPPPAANDDWADDDPAWDDDPV